MPQRGLFITFEGGEGSGKSTQSKRLAADLEASGYPVLQTHEPGGTPISQQIREILLNREHREMAPTTELLLYAAARAQHVSERVQPALDSGQIVICDRFIDSTVAYQGYGRGLDLDLIAGLNRVATKGLTPDLTFVLDLPVELGLQRAQQRVGALNRLELEELEFHRRLREGFLEIAAQEPNRVMVIDAQMCVDDVYQEIQAAVNRLLKDG
jgi:dTMP kinase